MAFKSGGSGADALFGSAAMDTLLGYAGNDRLVGLGGNDLLVGGIGGDRLLGGTGDDVVMAERALAVSGGTMVKPAGLWNSSPAMALSVDGAFNRAADRDIDMATARPHVTVEATGDGSIDFYAFTVTAAGSGASFDIDGAYRGDGTGFDSWLQVLDAAGNVLAFNDDGLTDPGSLEAYPSFSRDSFLTYTFADAGAYIVEVGAYSDVLPQPKPVPSGAGYALHISLDGGTGHGAQGPDTLKGGSGSDTLIGGAGTDKLLGGSGSDSLAGKGGADRLHGGAGADTLKGARGDDAQWGGLDDDRLRGGSGNDRLHGGAGADRLKGAHGNDAQWGGRDGDRLAGGVGADSLHGGQGADRLSAGPGNDLVYGGKGSDRLFGGSGADSLIGGGGKDTLTGGAGDDVFIFRKRADSPADHRHDRITDFSPGSDHVDLAAIDADPRLAGDDAFSFIAEAHFSHHAGELRYYHTAYATIVVGDITGDGHADVQIALVGNLTLADGDFVL